MREISAGAVLFRRNKEIKYLLLYREAHGNFKASWDVPKGNVEDKDVLNALKREIKEETGIEQINIIKDFKERIKIFYRKGNELVNKEIIFFLVETKEEDVKLSFEHQSYKWANLKEAIELIKYKNYKDLLEKADKFIKKHLEQKNLDGF